MIRMNPTIQRIAIIGSAFIALALYPPKAQYVYLCDSKASYAYHINPDCRALAHCKHGIIKTTKDSATAYYGRVACKVCSQ